MCPVMTLVASDGSPYAIAAVQRGLKLIRTEGTVTVLTVADAVPVTGGTAAGFAAPAASPADIQVQMDAQRDAAGASAEATEQALGTSDMRIELGDAGQVICATAEELSADVIVMGSRGHGFLGRVLLGSVSEYVVRNAPCPVLVVRNVEVQTSGAHPGATAV